MFFLVILKRWSALFLKGHQSLCLLEMRDCCMCKNVHKVVGNAQLDSRHLPGRFEAGQKCVMELSGVGTWSVDMCGMCFTSSSPSMMRHDSQKGLYLKLKALDRKALQNEVLRCSVSESREVGAVFILSMEFRFRVFLQHIWHK